MKVSCVIPYNNPCGVIDVCESKNDGTFSPFYLSPHRLLIVRVCEIANDNGSLFRQENRTTREKVTGF